MATKAKRPRKTVKKRGPKEERLVITDPETALTRLLMTKKPAKS